MKHRDLLLEIGCEELPAHYMKPALMDLQENSRRMLKEARLTHGEISVYGTPRRLALLVRELKEHQYALQEEIKGPPAKAAFHNGQPTSAARGFARAHQMQVKDLFKKETEKGEYSFLLKKEPGRPTQEVLPPRIPDMVRRISFPKTMRWGLEDFPFARPIRWLVLLYGKEVLELEISGVKSGNKSRGLRFFYPKPVLIEEAGLYLETLQEVGVLADHQKRKERIVEQLQEIQAEYRTTSTFPEDLIQENTFLVEFPTAFVGQFDSEYLELPVDVLKNAMQEHQRYFPVQGEDGNLRPYFIGIRNGGMESLPGIIQGNEQVIEARLSDARFFFHEDQKKNLEERGEDLKKVLFHEELGTLHQKLERMSYLATDLSRQLELSQEQEERIKRGVRLSKGDLTTEMVKEFPKLQGIIGKEYALLMGEAEEVAQAIGEQYQPRFQGDDLPQSQEGAVLSLVDKLDTIVAFFSIGLAPKSSQDPFALRRQGQGVVLIILDKGMEFSLQEAIHTNLKLFQGQGFIPGKLEERKQQLLSFFERRMERLLLDQGYAYDIVSSLLKGGVDFLYPAYKKARDLQKFRDQGRLHPLVVAFTRTARLSQKLQGGKEVQEHLFSEDSEQRLYEAYQLVHQSLGEALSQGDYLEGLQALETLIQPINEFFEEVLVMVEDEKLRENRLLLLQEIAQLYSPFGDLEAIVIEEED